MTRYVIDSYAWIEYLDGSVKGEKARGIIEGKNAEVFTSVITIAEVCAKARKMNSDPEEAFRRIVALSRVEPIDPLLAKDAGVFRQDMRKKIENFGLADAIILLTARALNAKVLSGDYHLKGFRETEFLG